MLIAIDGAQSTGKTTLFEQLRAYYASGFFFSEEPARVIAPLFEVATSADWSGLLTNTAQLSRFFDEEERIRIECQATHRDIVEDSSLYLIAAYRLTFDVPHDAQLLHGAPYDLIMYCPLDVEIEADGFRFLERRETVDTMYRHLVSQHHHGRFVELPCGDARLDAARAAIADSDSNPA